MGQLINTFDEIPAYQEKGYYQYELALDEKVLDTGIYFIRMTVNGRAMAKSVFSGK